MASKILGVVLLIRHGDRQEFYQTPDTYQPSTTSITPFGTQQEFQLGQDLRALYLNASSPSYILDSADPIHVDVRADAGGEGSVILKSAMALLQGLFPANPGDEITLANGTEVFGPLGGYQYIPIESVEPNNDISLEGFTSCGALDAATTAFYKSAAFKQKQNESAAFLNLLSPYLEGGSISLQNMWNIFDFMNVQSTYNASFAAALPPTFLAQARDLANWHEYGVFSSPRLTGIGNIAGQTIMPSILKGLASIANSSDPLKILYQAISYKPFISLFNMTGVAEANPELAGIVNYAAAVALEVRQPVSGGDIVLRFNFKNGTDDEEFKTYNFLNGTGDIPLSSFVTALAPTGVNTTAEWCSVCQNTQGRGCDALTFAASQARAAFHQRLSPIDAGFLGAGLTLAIVLAMFAVLALLGMVSVRKRKERMHQREPSEGSSAEEKA